MKIVEVPIINEDGSIKAVHVYSADEVQRLLQFATNFMMAIGNTSILMSDQQQEERPEKLDD